MLLPGKFRQGSHISAFTSSLWVWYFSCSATVLFCLTVFEIWHKGNAALSLGSLVVDTERIRSVDDFLAEAHFSLWFHSTIRRHQPPHEGGSRPGRLLRSVWGCRLSDLVGWCSATWYGDALVVSSSSLVGSRWDHLGICIITNTCKTRNVGQCPTWWPPCQICVAPSV